MTGENKLGIALVGCGGMMRAHIKALKELTAKGLGIFDVKAVCDTDEKAAAEAAKEVAAFRGYAPRAYTKLETMLSEESLDAVDIAVPHNLHHIVAIACFEAGLNVLIEKPLAITMRAAKRIIECASKHSLLLAVAENYRRSPENRAIRWAIERGLIGEPRILVWISASWGMRPWGWREDKFAAGGSWVFDGGVHFADLDRYQLGREAEEVYAVQRTFEPVKGGVRVTVDDATLAVITYEGGVCAQWLWTRVAPGKQLGFRVIYGSKGAIDYEGLYLQKEEERVEAKSMRDLVSEMLRALDPRVKERWFPRGITDTVATELYDFYEAVVNRSKPEVDGVEAYKDMAIPLAFYESAKLGKPVRVRDVEELRVEEYQGEINERLGIR